MKRKNLFFNRELSWLEFDQRVLEIAEDESVPLLDRLKFLSITASNLDEFFMVRIGGLRMLAGENIRKKDPSGLTPSQQIERVGKRVREIIAEQHACFSTKLEPALIAADIKRVLPQDLEESHRDLCTSIFSNELFPVLTPVSISAQRPFPLLKGGLIHFLILLKSHETDSSAPLYAVVPIPENLHRFVSLPTREKGYKYILIEDLIGMHLDKLFTGETIVEKIRFRITRNADMSVQEDLASDLLSQMEAVLDARKRSDCVRLEIDTQVSRAALRYLRAKLGIDPELVFMIDGPHNYASFMNLTSLEGYDHLRYEPQRQFRPNTIATAKNLFSLLSQKPVVLYHPYESFDPVVQLITEAAHDPDVLAIKQILYRTSVNSPIVEALKHAAESGKAVTALIELKARFDEARNITWANKLEDAGVQVIYGIKNLKTHAKLCIIVRRETQGIKRYCHFGTGNYNEKTATLYCDISYMTSDDVLGFDASGFFNMITGYSSPTDFRQIEAAPIGLKTRLLELIESETERKRQGEQAHIMLKANSLADIDIITALYRASAAGVPVEINIRGLCLWNVSFK
jgi:polyphosphate kinase